MANDAVIEYPSSGVAKIGEAVMPVGRDQITPAQIVGQLKDVAALPYQGKDADKIGMTLIEAALYSAVKKAADGDQDALEKVLNRLMGKPLQQVANLNMTASLKDFLEGIAREEPVEVSASPVDPFGE